MDDLLGLLLAAQPKQSCVMVLSRCLPTCSDTGQAQQGPAAESSAVLHVSGTKKKS